ncbi:MAG: DUF2142 domain-containing protein [Candidatus Saccharimonas sp.]
MSRFQLLKNLKVRLMEWASTPERVYLTVALVGVVGFVLITPPFQGPDEKSHYIRTQYVANGYILPVDAGRSGAHLPASIETVVSATYLKDSGDGGLKKYDIRSTYHALKTPLDADNTYQPPMISYTAVPYLPAVPGVVLSNALGLSPIIAFYVARLSLALFCVLLTYLAIKIVPYKKYLFVGIALTPMLLFQQSVVSADGTSYALLVFFICFVLHLRGRQNISNKQWLAIAGLCVSITLAKPLVFLFLPLILLLAKKNAAKILIPLITVLCIAVFAGITLYSSHRSEAVVDPNTPASVDSAMQLENIKENPKRFLRVMWNSYMTDYGDEETQGLIGIFGAADTKFPLSMTLIYTIILAYLAATRFKKDDEQKIVPRGLKIMLASLGALYFILVNVAIYLSFTPVNFNIVYGVQGRYFLPLLILAPLFTVPFLTILKKYQQKSLIYICVSLLILILAALFITFQRYYLFTP